MLDTNDKAPQFTLPDQDGHDISLSDLLKDGPAILYFYPADFTPGCTREACSIRDLHRELTRAGITVAGISPQSPGEPQAVPREAQPALHPAGG